ncbi:hypothetical protein CHCC20335_4656 [Bacillus paralicheniformis]|nr:hypothetical protein CHCC20335_4656 [Bacillus paralicheniformis]
MKRLQNQKNRKRNEKLFFSSTFSSNFITFWLFLGYILI